MEKTEEINLFSKETRRIILKTALNAGAKSAHIGGALSMVEIISTIFLNKIKKKIENHFILSKGHACLAYYAVLNQLKFINDEILLTFENDGSDLLGHPVKNDKIPIHFSTGSLGMGLSIGIGLAIASKKKRNNKNVYIVMGDGECNEGSVWEAAMAAYHLKLDNIFLIIDNNGFQQTGSNKDILDTFNLVEKWKSFGWNVKEGNGHNPEVLLEFLKNNNKIVNKPNVLIAKTIKGKGFKFSENNNNWHHNILTKSVYEEALKELEL
tara:strand:- start:694 stop:1494 length:801 start_codon:yes stop_codon:yes gene_type:complete